jgi:hypothetical protein
MSELRIQDLFTARICALLANVHRSSQSDKSYTPADFALFPPASHATHTNGTGAPAPPPPKSVTEWTEAEHLAILENLTKAFGGRDRRFGRTHG